MMKAAILLLCTLLAVASAMNVRMTKVGDTIAIPDEPTSSEKECNDCVCYYIFKKLISIC